MIVMPPVTTRVISPIINSRFFSVFLSAYFYKHFSSPISHESNVNKKEKTDFIFSFLHL
ncbi:hypothetical protein FH5_01705 [Priestia endophytica]|nr:hypothetical protein FH5_01705 [Priestia endophytica]